MLRLNEPLTQVIVLGFICFCCPGMFNSLSGTGTYGLNPKDSDVGNHATITFGCMFAISSLFAAALFNILGHRVLLILGGLTYVFYVGSFLAYHYISSIALIVVSSCILGVGAGWLWCAQGAVMMGYPREGEKGRYFSIFWSIFNLGSVLGNAIPIGLQWNNPNANSVSTGSYIGYMVVMTIGACISVFLLPTNKVIRRDGSHVTQIQYTSPMHELKSVFALFKDWRMLCLAPMFFTSNWFYTYQQNAVNAFNFGTPRSRSLNSMFYWAAQIFASIIFGAFLDRPQWSRNTRARYGIIVLTLFLAATWTGGLVFQHTFGPQAAIQNENGVWVKNPADFHSIDVVNNTSEFLGPFFLYFFFGASDAMFQGYAYWLMGALTNETTQAARFAGFYKFVQNIGGVLAPIVQVSVIGNGPSDGYNAQHAKGRGMGEAVICVVLVFIGLLGAYPVAFRAVKEHTLEFDGVEEKQEVDTMEDIKA